MKALSHFPALEETKTANPKHRDSFSCATDFALALIPITVGVAYVLIHDYMGLTSQGQEHFTGFMKIVFESDRSIGYRIFTYAGFLFGLGGALKLLSAMKKVEIADEKRLNRP